MNYASITATGSYLPEKIIINDELPKNLDTSDEWIKSRTGIKQRHIANSTETASYMAIKAAEEIFRISDTTVDEIDLIIVATCTADKNFPSVACLVQEKLGAKNAFGFDVSVACSGFIYALVVAEQFIKNNKIKKALVIGSETMSKVVDWEDRTTCVLFGDGAGACLLESSSEPGILASKLCSNGEHKDILYLNNAAYKKEDSFIHMNGQAVLKQAVQVLSQVAEEVVKEAGLNSKDIDFLVPHQANLRIIKATARRLGLSEDKIILCVAEHANTSAASIPLALDKGIKTGKIKKKDNLLLEAVGGGLTWGALLIKY